MKLDRMPTFNLLSSQPDLAASSAQQSACPFHLSQLEYHRNCFVGNDQHHLIYLDLSVVYICIKNPK